MQRANGKYKDHLVGQLTSFMLDSLGAFWSVQFVATIFVILIIIVILITCNSLLLCYKDNRHLDGNLLQQSTNQAEMVKVSVIKTRIKS